MAINENKKKSLRISQILYARRGYVLGILAMMLLVFPPKGANVSPAGILLLITGIIIRIVARRNIGAHSRADTLAAPRLIREGIYSKIRHPLYLSNGLIASGFLLFHLSWQNSTFLFAAVLWSFLLFLAQNEDSFLKREFGEEWEHWAEQTPAFLPRLRKISPKNSNHSYHTQSVREALLADSWTWFFLILYITLLLLRRFL